MTSATDGYSLWFHSDPIDLEPLTVGEAGAAAGRAGLRGPQRAMKRKAVLLQRYVEGQRLLFLAEQCLNLTRKSLEPILRRFDLSHPQYLVLLILGYAEATGQKVISTDLSYLLGREKHTMTPLVDSLVRGGLVRRGDDARDRRVIMLRLTRNGKQLLRTVQPLTVPTIADIPLGSRKQTSSVFTMLEAFRRAFAQKAGQNPDLYAGAFSRLLVAGESKLLQESRQGPRERAR